MTAKRKTYPASFKVACVDEWKSGNATYAQVIAKHKLWEGAIYSWHSKIGELRAAAAKEANASEKKGAEAQREEEPPTRLGRIKPDENGRYSEEQKQRVLAAMATGRSITAVSDETRISKATLHHWKANGGTKAAESTALVPTVASAPRAVKGRLIKAQPHAVSERTRLLQAIDRTEGLTRLAHARKALEAANQAGLIGIKDLTLFHLETLAGIRLMLGEP